MTKAKRIFGVIFASILLLMSVVVISLYDNVRENTPRDDNLTGILEDDLQLFTIAMAKTLDSNFEAVSFDAVSYTHLDVYKRQVIGWAINYSSQHTAFI